MKNRIILLGLFFFLFCQHNLQAQWVDLKIQVLFVPKILMFDRNLARFGDPINVGISSDEAFEAFDKSKDQLDAGGKKVLPQKMASIADMSKYKVVYVDTNWDADFAKVIETAKANQILVICRREDNLEKGGGISFRKVAGKPQIVVNQNNCKDQNSNFIANFLKAVIVI